MKRLIAKIILIGLALVLGFGLGSSFSPSLQSHHQEQFGNPLVTAFYQVTVSDTSGRVVQNYKRKSDSYVAAMNDFLGWTFLTGSMTGVIDTSNTSRSVAATRPTQVVNTGTTNVYGLVVGTGTNAVAISDYQLQTIIANGTGAGQLSYFAMSAVVPNTSGGTRSFTLTRAFKNNSAGSITVNELGLIMWETTDSWYFLIVRDVIGGGQVVTVGQTLTITYTIAITV